MWPAILGMTYALLPEEKAGLAGGLILGVAGLGNAAGPLLGGLLTDELSWRWMFFINLPMTAFAVLVTYRVVHESTVDATERHIDYAGIAVSVGRDHLDPACARRRARRRLRRSGDPRALRRWARCCSARSSSSSAGKARARSCPTTSCATACSRGRAARCS